MARLLSVIENDGLTACGLVPDLEDFSPPTLVWDSGGSVLGGDPEKELAERVSKSPISGEWTQAGLRLRFTNVLDKPIRVHVASLQFGFAVCDRSSAEPEWVLQLGRIPGRWQVDARRLDLVKPGASIEWGVTLDPSVRRASIRFVQIATNVRVRSELEETVPVLSLMHSTVIRW